MLQVLDIPLMQRQGLDPLPLNLGGPATALTYRTQQK